MEINWILLVIIAVFVIILILFIIRVNQKDKKKYTNFLNNDFKKPAFEAFLTEINLVQSDLKDAIKNINSWAKPKRNIRNCGKSCLKGWCWCHVG